MWTAHITYRPPGLMLPQSISWCNKKGHRVLQWKLYTTACLACALKFLVSLKLLVKLHTGSGFYTVYDFIIWCFVFSKLILNNCWTNPVSSGPVCADLHTAATHREMGMEWIGKEQRLWVWLPLIVCKAVGKYLIGLHFSFLICHAPSGITVRIKWTIKCIARV